MKTIKSLLTFGLSAVTALTITSCQDFDFMDEAEIKHDLTMNEYAQNFVAHYGNIDPNHTWGFGAIKGDGTTRANVAEKNLWVNTYHLTVPGWPDEYTGTYQYTDDSHVKCGYQATEPTDKLAAGDVTDEEIMYVSWWFRTHQNPKCEEVHWTDFFAQEISSDNDRYTERTTINGTTHEIGEIKKYQTIKEDGQEDKYQVQEYGMDQLKAWSVGLNGWDHIYNFNKTTTSNTLHNVTDVPMAGEEWYRESIVENCTGKRLIQYYESSGTEDFSAKYSQDNRERNRVLDSNLNPTDKKIWVLVHLSFDGRPDPVTGKARHYDGYYLGFDYQCQIYDGSGKKYIVDADGYYSNWIIKLSPGKAIENSGYSRRVMCEDLGNTYDFDFNDVVFDVTYNITASELATIRNNGGKSATDIDATITIQAAGGTMPIYVGVDPYGVSPASADDFTYEAHYLLGSSYNTPTNVSGKKKPVANYHVKVRSIDPGDIPVYVVNTRENNTVYTLATPNTHNLGNYTGSDSNGNIINGTAAAPQKFCVPNFVPWMQECKFIETAYPLFKAWAQNMTSCPEADSENAWFRKNVNFDNIYGGSIVMPEINNEDGNDSEDSTYGKKVTPETYSPNEGYYLNFIPVSSFQNKNSVEITLKWAQKKGESNAKNVYLYFADANHNLDYPNQISPNEDVIKDGDYYYVTYIIPSSSFQNYTYINCPADTDLESVYLK